MSDLATDSETRGIAYMLWYLLGMSEETKYNFDMGYLSAGTTDIAPKWWSAAKTLQMNYDMKARTPT